MTNEAAVSNSMQWTFIFRSISDKLSSAFAILDDNSSMTRHRHIVKTSVFSPFITLQNKSPFL